MGWVHTILAGNLTHAQRLSGFENLYVAETMVLQRRLNWSAKRILADCDVCDVYYALLIVMSSDTTRRNCNYCLTLIWVAIKTGSTMWLGVIYGFQTTKRRHGRLSAKAPLPPARSHSLPGSHICLLAARKTRKWHQIQVYSLNYCYKKIA